MKKYIIKWRNRADTDHDKLTEASHYSNKNQLYFPKKTHV
jgi:hypothetical protein